MRRTALHLPFQAYHYLREWYESKYRRDSPDSDYVNRQVQTYFEGMKHWFHHQPATIRVCSYGEDENYTDVQFEMYVGRSSIQIYLMTLVTPEALTSHHEIAKDFGVTDLDMGVEVKDLDDPFSRPTVIWPAPKLKPDEIVKAVEAWSKHFWPDFECEYRYEVLEEDLSEDLLEGEFKDWRALVKTAHDSHCKVLLQCDPVMVPDIQKWALDKGCTGIYVSQNFLVLLDSLPISLLEDLEAAFPALAFVAASLSSGPLSH